VHHTNKGTDMKKRNITFLALLISAMISIVVAETIPLPEWAETSGSPTGSVQALEYINSVRDLLETEVQDELASAESPEAKLAVVYRESIKSRLYKAENSGDTYALMKALAEIQRFLELYKSQWKYLYQGDNNWSLNLTDSNSIGRVMAQLNAIKELQKRLDDPNDSLEGLTNYNEVFKIPGGAMAAYEEMREAFNHGKKERAEDLIAFLLQDVNKNGFIKGNTFFYKSRVARVWYDDYTNSIENVLQVHKYPSCLVYIASAYFDAAKMFRTLGSYELELAFASVEIPNIDNISKNMGRNLLSAEACMSTGDNTNGIRHLQAAIYYDKNKGIQKAGLKAFFYPIKDKNYLSNVWSHCASKPLKYEDTMKELRKGYYFATNMWCCELIQDALEHDWPSPNEVSAVILSNRVLSNNIFEYKKRDIK